MSGGEMKKGAWRTPSDTSKRTFSMVWKSVRWKRSTPRCAAGWSRSLTCGSIARQAGAPATPSKRKSQPSSPCHWPVTISAAAAAYVLPTVAGSLSNPTVIPCPSNTPEPCWNCGSNPIPSQFTEAKSLSPRHPRNYGRNQDIENPDHLSRLLEERKRGEDAALLARFLALSSKAESYYGALRQRELHAMGHVRRTLMLVDIHGRDAVSQALEQAIELGSYGFDYLTTILAHRRALLPLTGQLHLTRGAELLSLEVQQPDCSRYQIDEQHSPSDK